MRSFIYLIGICTVAFFSCTKTPFNPVNGDIKANFNYKPGSYWVYKDSLSEQVDSYSVQSNTVQNANVLTESIFINVARKNIIYDTDTAAIRCVLSRNYFQTYAVGATVTYPFTVGYMTNGSDVLSVGGSYTVNGEVFNDVATVARTVQTATITYIDTFYINADVGIIKINEYQEIDTPIIHRIWELQRRNIIR